MGEINKTYCGDALEVLKTFPDNFVDCVVTSPPYFGLRDYGVTGQIGLEPTPELYVSKMVSVFDEVKRVLKPTGTLWLNLGDSYATISGRATQIAKGKTLEETKYSSSVSKEHTEGIGGNKNRLKNYKHKDLIGIPWMVAFALRSAGWYLRSEIIWHKKNPMPESVTDRPTKAHEQIFLLSKSAKYYYDAEAIMDEASYDGRKDTRMKGSHKYSQGVTGLQPQTFAARGHERWRVKDGIYLRNKRSVWTVSTNPFPEAHFATFPPELIVDCIKAGCPPDGLVLDPFNGSGTTRIVAEKLGRNSIGIELNPKYIDIENRRRKKELGMFEKIAS